MQQLRSYTPDPEPTQMLSSQFSYLQQSFQPECPICLCEYNIILTVPMMICYNQHSSCQKCLSLVYKKRKCPICNEKLINRNDVKKNRLVCCMIQQNFRKNGETLLTNKQYMYKGSVKNGKRHGIGQLVTKQGNYFKGKFVQGQIQGKCSVTTKNGAKFNGQAIDGRLQGTFTTKYGSVVEGNFDIQTLSGPNCKKKYTNGDVYEGMINKLKANGFGKLTFNNGNIFQGNFCRDYIENQSDATISGKFQVYIKDGGISIKQVEVQIQKPDFQQESGSVNSNDYSQDSMIQSQQSRSF